MCSTEEAKKRMAAIRSEKEGEEEEEEEKEDGEGGEEPMDEDRSDSATPSYQNGEQNNVS